MDVERFARSWWAVGLIAASAVAGGCSSEPAGGSVDASGARADASSPTAADASGDRPDAAEDEDASTGAGADAWTPDVGPVAAADAGAPDAAPVASVDGGGPAVGDPTVLPPGVATVTWQGTLANKEKVEVTYPASWPAKLPLVVHAHGFQLGRGDYADTADHLARYGYAVASVDYPNSLFSFDHHDVVVAITQAIDLLTTDPPAELAGRIDAARVASMGHSVGGKGAVWAAVEDARIKAVVALDPVDDDPNPNNPDWVKHPSVTPEKMGGLAVPALYVGAGLGGSCAPAASNACRFEEASPPGVAHHLAVLEGFGHMQFVESSFCLLCPTCSSGASGAALDLSRASLRGVLVAFLEEALRDDPRWSGWLAGAERDGLAGRDVILDAAEQVAFCAPP